MACGTLAAAAFRPTAPHCLELGVVDAVVPEPEGGAHLDHDGAAELLSRAVSAALTDSSKLDPASRLATRRDKFRSMGTFT